MNYTSYEWIMLIIAGALTFMLISYWLVKILNVNVSSKFFSLNTRKDINNHLECPYRYDIERLLNVQKNYLKSFYETKKQVNKVVERYATQNLSACFGSVLDSKSEEESFKYYRLLLSTLKCRLMSSLLSILENNHFPVDTIEKRKFIDDKIDFLLVETKKYLRTLASGKYFEKIDNFYESKIKDVLKHTLENIFSFMFKEIEDMKNTLAKEKNLYAQKALKILKRQDEVDL